MEFTTVQFIIVFELMLSVGIFLFYGLVYDIREVAEKKDGFQEAESLRNLLWILSHDLGNSLTIILNYSAKVASMLEPGKPKQFAEKILKAAETQQEIIDHVKQMQLVKSGKIALQIEPVRLAEIYETIQLIFEARLETKGINIVTNLDEKKEVAVLADASCLANHVLCNIISNAIKFSMEGGRITLMVEDNKEEVCVSISDEGIGIPASIVENLFREDKPTNRPGTQGEAGTGYGMPIVKAYVDKLEGRLELDTKTQEEYPDSHGTTLKVYLKNGTQQLMADQKAFQF